MVTTTRPPRKAKRLSLPLFPKCELHGCRLVHGFPAKCPLAKADPDAALFAIYEASFRSGTGGDLEAAVGNRAVYDICNDCVRQNLRNPSVRLLRRRKGVQT